jgi:hypothetical protein
MAELHLMEKGICMKLKLLMRRYPYFAAFIFSAIFVLLIVAIFWAAAANYVIIRQLFPYVLPILWACQGGLKMIQGVHKLRQAKNKQEQTIWYKQSSIIWGIFFITASLVLVAIVVLEKTDLI